MVRGRDVGRVFNLRVAETILGNSLNGEPGLDLREQEGSSPRRMAARQAAIVVTGQELAIRDLDSPGGTFVNRQRLLAGQSRRLQAGDVIQVGSVQLRVVGQVTSPTPVPPASDSATLAAPVGAGLAVAFGDCADGGASGAMPAGRLPVRSSWPAARRAGPGTISWFWRLNVGKISATSSPPAVSPTISDRSSGPT